MRVNKIPDYLQNEKLDVRFYAGWFYNTTEQVITQNNECRKKIMHTINKEKTMQNSGLTFCNGCWMAKEG